MKKLNLSRTWLQLVCLYVYECVCTETVLIILSIANLVTSCKINPSPFAHHFMPEYINLEKRNLLESGPFFTKVFAEKDTAKAAAYVDHYVYRKAT